MSCYDMLYVIIWYLMVLFIGIITLPIAISTFRNLPDHGYSISKTLGILLAAYISWILSYVIGYNRYVILLSIGLISIISVYSYVKLKKVNSGLLFRNELLFTLVFLFFLIIRSFNPEIHGGEKISDFMLLNSILKSNSFPPHDSWLSGFSINMYYYFGTYVIATLTKLTGIPSYISYNLAMALIPALVANAAYGIGYNLTNSKKAAFIGMFLLVFAGNLYPAAVVTAHLIGITTTSWGKVPEILDYWSASRVIPYTINEFPYFSFIFGDLHAHVIAMPFVLLAIMLILNNTSSTHAFILLSLSIGSLFVFNSWDYPTYAALFIVSMIVSKKRFISALLVIFLGFLMFLPFFISFEPSGVSGIKSVSLRTQLISFLGIYDLFLFLIFTFLLINLPDFEHKKKFLAVLALFLLLYLFPNFQILAILLPLAVLTGMNIYSFYRNNDTNRLFVSLLIAMGLWLLLFCELWYFDDLLGGAWERMNTVFKYYIQVWLLWSIASACAFFDMYKKEYVMKKIALAIFSLLLVLNSFYLITGTYAKTNGFSESAELDGMSFMKKIDYGAYDAIHWINMNISKGIILEAPGSSYTQTSLISAFTGLPTVIGWATHEYMWRNNWEEISKRIRDVDMIYNTQNYHDALELLRKYNVSYVYVGEVESKKYQAKGLSKFENTTYFKKIYRGVAQIYQVKEKF